MKRKTFIFSMLLFLLLLPGNLIFAKEKSKIDFEITRARNYYYEDEEKIIIGNPTNLRKEDIDLYISFDKKVFVYDYYRSDVDSPIYNNSSILYSKHHLKHMDTLIYETSNFNDFSEEVIQFYLDKTKDLELNVDTRSESLFDLLYTGSFREMKVPYGYIDVFYNVKKYRTNDVSSLYILETNISFVPGKIAKLNGDNRFNNWNNLSGYLHVEAKQSENEIGPDTIRRGGVPKYKDAYPVNVPGVITISSTYSIGVNLGYSFTNGFSLDNITAENTTNLGLNIGYSYNKSYTKAEPSLSTQNGSNNINQYQWYYEYVDKKCETNHINTGYVFEMNNYNHDLLEGDVSLLFNYKMKVKDDG